MQCTPCSQTLYPDKYSQFRRLSLLRMTRRVVIPGDEIERRITELLSFIWRERSLDKTEGPVLEREESKYRLKRSIDNWKTKWWFSVTILVLRQSVFSLSAMDLDVSILGADLKDHGHLSGRIGLVIWGQILFSLSKHSFENFLRRV